MRFHHVGICCKDIGTQLEKMKKVHKIVSVSETVHDNEQNASLCMVEVEDGLKIELISGPQVENLLKKGFSLYHICFEVDDIEEEKKRIMKGGGLLISDLKEAKLFGGKRVCFFKMSYGIAELVEGGGEKW